MRVAIFIDGNNYYLALRDFDQQLELDMEHLASWLTRSVGGRLARFVGAYYYTGVVEGESALGGFLTSCLYGLPGIRIGPGEPESWCVRPVTLPKGWTEVHVDRVWARGGPVRLTARHGDDRAVLEPDRS